MSNRPRYYSHGHYGHTRHWVRPAETPRLEITGETVLHTGLHLYETAYKVSARGDPDHESIGDVLQRLENYQNHSGLPPICTHCHCQRESVKNNSDRSIIERDDSDFDSDSDDEGVLTIDQLLKVLDRYMSRASSASQLKTVIRLINSHTVNEDVTPQQVSRLQTLLRTTKPEFREAGLLFIKQLSCMEENARVMSDNEIFNDILTVLSSPHSIRVQVAALKAAEQLFSHNVVADHLAEAVDEVMLPVLLRILYSDHPLDMKYASCCVLRSLSQHESTALHVGQELLFIIKELKESSSKMKEVFVEIVINLYRQTDVVYPDMIDKNILHSTAAMIVDGPCSVQRQALCLVLCLVEEEQEGSEVINNRNLLLYLLQCLRDSHCRKVREVAGKIVAMMMGYRKPSLARSLMEHLAAFLSPEEDYNAGGDVTSRGSARIVYPVRVKHQAESRNWQALEDFLKLMGQLITKEAMIQTDKATGQMLMDDNPTSEWNTYQLGCLATLVSIATALCHWPLEKFKSSQKLDLSDFTDDDHLRKRLQGVNRQMTADVWSSCGRQMAVLLSKFAEKVQIRCNPLSSRPGSRSSSRPHSPVSARRSKTPRGEILSGSEINLVNKLLEFFLFVSVATCTDKKKFKKKELMFEKAEKDIQTRTKDGLWIMANPHLTQSLERRSTSESTEIIERRQQELSEKEANADRRLLRRGLYESDLFRIASPFVSFENEDVRVVSSLLLRCAIQPLEEKLLSSDQHVSYGSSSGPMAAFKPRLRPQSAKSHREREKKLGIALHRMSPEVAGVIKSALRQRPMSASAAERGSASTVNARPASSSRSQKTQPVLDMSQPIAHQCRKVTVENCGAQLIRGLFNKNRDVRKSCLLLIRDLVNHGNVETNMQLSELGCIPRIIDFLRINEEDEMLEIIAVILARMMITSDQRLKNLFNRHGGSDLLLSMSHTCSGVLREEVKVTLNTLTTGVSQRVRPSSAPAMRSTEVTKEPDIWDNIMRRWQQEDRVVQVFQKWM